MSFRLLILFLSDAGAGSLERCPGSLPASAAVGCPSTAEGVGALFSPVEAAAYSVSVWVLCLISVELQYGLCTWFPPGSSNTPAAHTECS